VDTSIGLKGNVQQKPGSFPRDPVSWSHGRAPCTVDSPPDRARPCTFSDPSKATSSVEGCRSHPRRPNAAVGLRRQSLRIAGAGDHFPWWCAAMLQVRADWAAERAGGAC